MEGTFSLWSRPISINSLKFFGNSFTLTAESSGAGELDVGKGSDDQVLQFTNWVKCKQRDMFVNEMLLL